MINEVEKKGVIFFDVILSSSRPFPSNLFQDVCKLILRKFREDDEEEFFQIMFKVKLVYYNDYGDIYHSSTCVGRIPTQANSEQKNTR